MHKRFMDMLRLAGEKGIPVRLHTNATLMDGDLAARMLDCHALEEISFSFDGEDKGYYERVRVNADYDKTLANIRRFLQIKKEHRQKLPRVLIQVIKERTPDGKKPVVSREFRSLFDGLHVDKFHAISFHNFAGTLEAGGDVKYQIDKHEYKPCRHPWKSLCVAWDGDVVGCCVDVNKQQILGDLNKQTVMEVWNGKPMVEFRRALAEGRYKDVELCRECDMHWR
jgi:radical SAM protein with 4Fe4S-binding SPASM domain